MDENSSPSQPNANFTTSANSTTPPPSQEPEPVANNFGTPPTPTSTPTSTPKWPLIVAMAVGGVGVVVAGCLLVPRIFGSPNYGESYQLLTQLNDEFDQMWGSSQSSCATMMNNISDYDVAATTYSQYIDECQQDLTKIWDTSSKLGKSSGVTKDSELKQKFDAFESSLAASVPAKNDFEQMKKTYTAAHEFIIRLNTVGVDSSEADINTAAKVLIDSGSSKWASFGQEWQAKMLKFSNARRAYEEISYSDPQYKTVREAYYEARNDLDTFLKGLNSGESDTGEFNVESIDQLEDDYDSLRAAIRTAYENHYDGKNPEKCIDFGNGEASCD